MYHRNKKAFTLIEAIFVIAVIAALAALAIPRIAVSIQNAQLETDHANVAIINSSLAQYKLNNGSCPTAGAQFTAFLQDPVYFAEEPVCPYGVAYGDDYNATDCRVVWATHLAAHP